MIAVGLVCTAGLWAQSIQKFSWQDACFKNPGAPYCPGHDFAIKPQPPTEPKSKGVVNQVFSPNANVVPRGSRINGNGTTAPALISIGGIDWRFADPFPDALIGMNFSTLSSSPLARALIALLGAQQGLNAEDLQKIFDGLSDVDQVALSLHNNRMVGMITGRVTETAPTAPEAGFKILPVTGNSLLLGHGDAVDQAARRVAGPDWPSDLTRLAEEKQASCEFWVIGSPGLAGPQAASTGLKRFTMAVYIRDRLISDIAFEFNGTPSPAVLKNLQTAVGPISLEGNIAHYRMSMEANEVQQKFAQIAASPAGKQLSALVAAAKYIPARDTSVPKQTKPVIYGLDDGPRVVNQ
jgi:hypothetical protein